MQNEKQQLELATAINNLAKYSTNPAKNIHILLTFGTIYTPKTKITEEECQRYI